MKHGVEIVGEFESDEESAKDKLLDQIHAAAPEDKRPPKFPEVVGICRNCSEAFIYRRQYDTTPVLICTALLGANGNRRIPLDITECTNYDEKGRPSLRQLAEQALLIDQRKKPGQYL